MSIVSDENVDARMVSFEEGDPVLPAPDLLVDFGELAPGSDNPMPAERRAEYERRIRSSSGSRLWQRNKDAA
jgi:hypothetical protein